jgi:hypothetical protein
MFKTEIAKYVAHVRQDFVDWMVASKCGADWVEKSLKEFDERVEISEGKKYIRVVIRGTVSCFIVKEAGGKFRQGDVLKAAGFNAPAKNFARANIFDGNYMNIKWTGA